MHEVVTDLAQQERERKASEEARRLAKQAQQLERILTDDFRSLQMELEKIRRLARLRQGEMIDALVPGLGRVQTDSKLGGPEQGDGTRGELAGIWGNSASDIFAVGE